MRLIAGITAAIIATVGYFISLPACIAGFAVASAIGYLGSRR